MKKFIKIFTAIIITIVLLIVVTAVSLPFIIDPNDYKPQISKLVKDQTGRDLSIPGEIKLSVFPWLGLQMGKVELSNAKGFKPDAFASIKNVNVNIELLPLLKKQIHLGRVELDGLELNLQRNKQGVSNWDDLVKPAAEKPKQATQAESKGGASFAITSLVVRGISISNANVLWQDRQNNQSVKISPFNFETGRITPNEPFAVSMQAGIDNQQPAVKGDVALKTKLTLSLADKLVSLQGLTINTNLKGKTLPGGKLVSQLSSDKLNINLEKQTINTSNLTLNAYDLKLVSEMQVTGLDSKPRYKVSLATDEFSLRQVLNNMAIELPAMADKNTLNKVRLSTKLVGGLNQVSVSPLNLQLDDSNLNGNIKVTNFSKPVIRYNLQLDQMDVDRYLPPVDKSKGKTAAPSTQATSAALQLPTELLRSLDVKGDIKIGKVKVSNLHSEKINLTTTAKGGVIHFYPINASMYQGRYEGNTKVDVRGNTPLLTMNEKLSNVQIGPLLKDFMGNDKILGKANLTAKLTARGIDPLAIRKSLSGNASFRFDNGVYKGFDLVATERKLEALKNKQPAPKETEPKQTKFGSVKGTLQLKNGLVNNNDLDVITPHARAQGKGSANLVNEKIDYRLFVKFTSTAEVNSKTYAQINKTPLPVHFSGTFTAPKVSIDYNAVIKAEVKKQVKKKTEQKKQEMKKKLEQKIDNKLKDLFRR